MIVRIEGGIRRAQRARWRSAEASGTSAPAAWDENNTMGFTGTLRRPGSVTFEAFGS